MMGLSIVWVPDSTSSVPPNDRGLPFSVDSHLWVDSDWVYSFGVAEAYAEGGDLDD